MQERWKPVVAFGQLAAFVAAVGLAMYELPDEALAVVASVVPPFAILMLLILTGIGPRVRNGSKRT